MEKSREELDRIAELFKTLGDVTRIQILYGLEDEKCVSVCSFFIVSFLHFPLMKKGAVLRCMAKNQLPSYPPHQGLSVSMTNPRTTWTSLTL